MRALAFAAIFFFAQAAFAQLTPSVNSTVAGSTLDPTVNCVVCSVNGKTGAVTTATLPGNYTVQSGGSNPLPAATANVGRYANVIDLAGVTAAGGNGTGLVYSNGICWSRFRTQVTPQSVALATTVPIAALTMSSVIQLTGSGLSTATSINITGACQGDIFRVLYPAGLVGTLGSLGISINSAASLPVPALAGALSGTWAEYSLSGTTVIKVGGGSL